MTIAVGQSAIFANFNSSPRNTVTGINTSASGSSFVVYVVVAGTLPTAAQISDTVNGVASGNTYTQIGSNSTIAGESSAIYYCQNGVGGTNQIWSAAWTGGSQQILVAAVEITGGALTGLLDQISSPMWNDDTSSPFTANAITPAQAAELVLAFCYSASNSGTEVPTFGSGFSTAVYAGDASTITGGIAKQVINSTSSVNISYTLAGAGSTESVTSLVSFKAPAGSTAYTLTVAKANVPVVGETVNFKSIRNMAVTRATLAVTGQTVNFKSGHTLPVTFAAVPVVGKTVSFVYTPTGSTGYVLPVGTAIIPVLGAPVFADYALGVAFRSVPVVAQAVTLTYTPSGGHTDYSLTVTSRAIAVAGQNVSFTATTHMNYSLPVTAAAVPVVGEVVNLRWSGAPVIPSLPSYAPGFGFMHFGAGKPS